MSPYSGEHSCRLNDPGKYDSMARKNCAQKHNDKCIDVIYGIKNGKSEIQALRYPKGSWDAGAAQSHCSSRGGSFEAASKSEEDNVKCDQCTVKNVEEKTNYGFNIVNKGDRHIIAGYASYVMIDSDEQLVTKEALEESLKRFMADPERRNIMFQHEGIKIGKVLDEEIDGVKTHVDDKGLFIVAEIYNDIETAKDVWKGILDDEYNAFSISFEPLKKAEHVVDGVWEEVKKINLLEASVCQNPKNPLSRFEILSKSKNVEEKKRGANMTEEEIKVKPKLPDEELPAKIPLPDQAPQKPMPDKPVPDKPLPDDEEPDDIFNSIRAELDKLKELGSKIGAQDLSELARLVTELRTGGQKSYPFPVRANKSEKDDWHLVISNAIDDLYNRIDKTIIENKSSDTVRTLKAEVVKKAEEVKAAEKVVEETKKQVTEVKDVANEDRKLIAEVQESFKNINTTLTKLDDRLKNLEQQKDVKTKASPAEAIRDYHPSNVRETQDGVEVLLGE